MAASAVSGVARNALERRPSSPCCDAHERRGWRDRGGGGGGGEDVVRGPYSEACSCRWGIWRRAALGHQFTSHSATQKMDSFAHGRPGSRSGGWLMKLLSVPRRPAASTQALHVGSRLAGSPTRADADGTAKGSANAARHGPAAVPRAPSRSRFRHRRPVSTPCRRREVPLRPGRRAGHARTGRYVCVHLRKQAVPRPWR